jgi:hypothetical protein
MQESVISIDIRALCTLKLPPHNEYVTKLLL